MCEQHGRIEESVFSLRDFLVMVLFPSNSSLDVRKPVVPFLEIDEYKTSIIRQDVNKIVSIMFSRMEEIRRIPIVLVKVCTVLGSYLSHKHKRRFVL